MLEGGTVRAEVPAGGSGGVLAGSAASRRNAHLTERENRGAGRHGWLRLTPAYSHRLVADALGRADVEGAVVLDPFSGSGTTGLAAAEHGLRAHLVDVNPFLVWFAAAKTRRYSAAEIEAALTTGHALLERAPDVDPVPLWQPALHRIDRWWRPVELAALKVLRHLLDEAERQVTGPVADLLRVALCRTLIETSNAAFDHQSMSFAEGSDGSCDGSSQAGAWAAWRRALEFVVASARQPPLGEVTAHLGDARDLGATLTEPVDLLYTSPPYANRMSYVRELRPYMYWLRYLTEPADAGELDWSAIGGTWGVATSRVGAWEPTEPLPLAAEVARAGAAIRATDGRNADLLARYVHKYVDDMWRHFRSAAEVVRSGGRVVYVVGNSSFFGQVVPVQDWYAHLLDEAGFTDVSVRSIRKRNSNKALYEYAVEAARP
jgi:SAM-dependent methyltransferase